MKPINSTKTCNETSEQQKKWLNSNKNKLNNIKKNAFFNKCQTQP